MEELELKALDFLKNREFSKAVNLYLKLAMANVDEEKYLISAANCYDALGDKKSALGIYKKVLTLNSQSLCALLNISTIYYELKKYDKSEFFAKKVLEQNPNNFSALLNLANVYYVKKEFKEALWHYERLYELNSNSYNAIINIANTAYNLGMFEKAVEFAKKAIDKRPNSVDPYIVAGNSFVELLKSDEAVQYLKKATDIAPMSEWVCNSVANLFCKMGRYEQGIAYAWKMFFLKGYQVFADDHINFGYLLYEAFDEGYEEVVEKYLVMWERHFEDNPIVKHMCCALRNHQILPTTDIEYVKGLFDGFANSFDDILKDLDYVVPEVISSSLKEVVRAKLFKKHKILDLGCGTGLCVEALRNYFPNEEYYGVDISENMLAKARDKNIYQELYCDDIVKFLENNDKQYHVVMAGDVLTYIGDLKKIFHFLIKNVEVNGYFCCSISKNDYDKSEYYLTPSGRFVHTISYVLRQLKHCGFEVIKTTECVLRKEGAKNIEGVVILVRKEIDVQFE